MTSPPRPRRPRLTLKMTLGIVLLIALGLGYWVAEARKQASILALIRKDRGSSFAYAGAEAPGLPEEGSGRVPLVKKPWWPPARLERWLGPDLFRGVAEVRLGLRFGQEGPGEDELIAAVTRLRRVRVLAVEFDVDDARAGKLAGMPSLEDLDLPQFNAGLTDRGMRSIGSIATLKSLRINHKGVTPAGLAALAGLTRLESLHSATMTTEPDDRGVYVRPKGGPDWSAGLAPLAGLPRLKIIDLAVPNLGGDALRHLGRIKTLKMIELEGLSCADDDLRHLASLPDLQVLGLGETTLDGSGLRHLAGSPRLAHVTLLRAPRLADPAVAELANFPALESAMLDGTRLTIDGLIALRAAPKLAFLRVDPPVADEAGRLQAALPRCQVDNDRGALGTATGFGIDLK